MSKKIIASLVVVCMVVLAGVFVTTYAVNASFPSGSSASSTLTGVVGKTWNTVSTVVQVIAVAAVVFAGVRYMYASAERRADIKKGLSYLEICFKSPKNFSTSFNEEIVFFFICLNVILFFLDI